MIWAIVIINLLTGQVLMSDKRYASLVECHEQVEYRTLDLKEAFFNEPWAAACIQTKGRDI